MSVVRLESTYLRVTTAPQSDIIHRSPQDIGGDYRVFGLIKANGDPGNVPTRQFFPTIHPRTTEMDANGVILEPGPDRGKLAGL